MRKKWIVVSSKTFTVWFMNFCYVVQVDWIMEVCPQGRQINEGCPRNLVIWKFMVRVAWMRQLKLLRPGRVIAVPTDTLYGLACDAWYDVKSVETNFQLFIRCSCCFCYYVKVYEFDRPFRSVHLWNLYCALAVRQKQSVGYLKSQVGRSQNPFGDVLDIKRFAVTDGISSPWVWNSCAWSRYA